MVFGEGGSFFFRKVLRPGSDSSEVRGDFFVGSGNKFFFFGTFLGMGFWVWEYL